MGEGLQRLPAPVPAAPPAAARPPSPWSQFRRRFARHRPAMLSLVVLIVIGVAAELADLITPYGYADIDLPNRSTGPSLADGHYFGTDKLGRDYFSRVLHGTRTSMRVAVLVAVLATAIGTVVGAVAGYYRGWVDDVLMRLTDLVLTLPSLAILLIAAAYLGQGSPYRVAVILALIFWTSLARIVRGSFLSLREQQFVEAAWALGAGDVRIIFRHILPNALSPIIVNATFVIASAVLVESTLSFLGFGIQPPTPALGQLIADAQGAMLTDWWLIVMPGLTLVVICLAINFVGDGLRDALDPQQGQPW